MSLQLPRPTTSLTLFSVAKGERTPGGMPLSERILAGSMPVTECGCWIWLKCGSRLGYGYINIATKMVCAHRASWMAFRGKIPDGLHVLHTCDVPSCVNPDHLRLGTHATNMAERFGRGRVSGVWRLSSATVMSKPIKRTGLSWRERIEALCVPVTECGCWIWLGTTRGGYGRISDYRGRARRARNLSAHRVAYEAFVGRIPKGLKVLHRCDMPSCVNPDHLFLGTQDDNMADRAKKGRNPPARLGEDSPSARLTAECVMAIRQSKDRAKDIAPKYGVSKFAIYAIRARRCWRHI